MPRLRALLATLALATIVACDSSPSAPDNDPQFAKGGNGGGGSAPIKVEATDPTGAAQETTLDVRVLGSGFDSNAEAAFLLDGSFTPGVTAGETRFVSETELVVEITIALDADVALYDVEVASAGRRRGIGTEIFAVLQKGGGPPAGPEPRRVRIPLVVRTDPLTQNRLESDGLGEYDHAVCGVQAAYVADLDFFTFDPLENSLTKKQKRDLERSCGERFPRTARLNLEMAKVHLGGDGGHGDDVLLTKYIFSGDADDFTPDDQDLRKATSADFAQLDGGESLFQGRSFTLAYCLDDGRGSPMRFDPTRFTGSSFLELSRSTSGDVFTVRTQAYPNNIGGCEHGRDDGSIVSLLLHIDLAYTVEPVP